jgi:acetyltransferase
LRERTDKNVAFLWTSSRGDTATLPQLKAANVPIFYSPVNLARGLQTLLRYHAWRERRSARPELTTPALSGAQESALARVREYAGRSALSEREAKQIIEAWGVPIVREIRATTEAEATEAAQRLGYPVVLKIDSPDIPHKTEAGGVRVNLRGADEVRAAYREITANAVTFAPGATISGVLVQEMVTGGVEVIVGVKVDPQVGPMLLFGLGGIQVEIHDDFALRHCPIDAAEAADMIAEVKGAKLLAGFRGLPHADVDALARTLAAVSQLAVALGRSLAELDINPLMVLPKGEGVKAVDALIVPRAQSAEASRH